MIIIQRIKKNNLIFNNKIKSIIILDSTHMIKTKEIAIIMIKIINNFKMKNNIKRIIKTTIKIININKITIIIIIINVNIKIKIIIKRIIRNIIKVKNINIKKRMIFNKNNRIKTRKIKMNNLILMMTLTTRAKFNMDKKLMKDTKEMISKKRLRI